ncbi:hypothetical protein SDC9_99166 [bioreactor metagenome]|uniref:Uncharacterized protein n=1 Tax=bioreactor metagenome TaxID=1076179 RepID=A0A645AHB3_9ZZZZ
MEHDLIFRPAALGLTQEADRLIAHHHRDFGDFRAVAVDRFIGDFLDFIQSPDGFRVVEPVLVRHAERKPVVARAGADRLE